MDKLIKSLVRRLVVILVLIAIYSFIAASFSVVFTNEVALTQFDDTAASFTNLSTLNHLWVWGGWILTGGCLGIITPAIIKTIKKLKENIDNEENS